MKKKTIYGEYTVHLIKSNRLSDKYVRILPQVVPYLFLMSKKVAPFPNLIDFPTLRLASQIVRIFLKISRRFLMVNTHETIFNYFYFSTSGLLRVKNLLVLYAEICFEASN